MFTFRRSKRRNWQFKWLHESQCPETYAQNDTPVNWHRVVIFQQYTPKRVSSGKNYISIYFIPAYLLQMKNFRAHKTTSTSIFHNCIHSTRSVRWKRTEKGGKWTSNLRKHLHTNCIVLTWILLNCFFSIDVFLFLFSGYFSVLFCANALQDERIWCSGRTRNINTWLVPFRANGERSLLLFITRIDLKMMSTHFLSYRLRSPTCLRPPHPALIRSGRMLLQKTIPRKLIRKIFDIIQ